MDEVKTDNLLRSFNAHIQQIHSPRVFVCLFLITIMIIIYFGCQKIDMNLSLGQTRYSDMKPRNVLLRREFDVVLSYYAEDVHFVARFIRYLRNTSTLQKLKSRIIVYNKNSQINTTYLQTVLQADIVQQLPTVGREGETYLHHIIEDYDTLADHILFSQAGVEGITDTGLADWFSDRLEKQFNASVGYMPLVENRWFVIYDCSVRVVEDVKRLPDLWGIIEQTLCHPGGQVATFRGQFLVSAKRIRNRPLRVYKYINELLTANQTHWLYNDPRSPYIGQSTPDNPKFGYVVELLWTTLFHCVKPDLFKRCLRRECACFD